jgi:hypothetical protein
VLLWAQPAATGGPGANTTSSCGLFGRGGGGGVGGNGEGGGGADKVEPGSAITATLAVGCNSRLHR